MVNLKVYLVTSTANEEEFLSHFANMARFIRKNDLSTN